MEKQNKYKTQTEMRLGMETLGRRHILPTYINSSRTQAYRNHIPTITYSKVSTVFRMIQLHKLGISDLANIIN